MDKVTREKFLDAVDTVCMECWPQGESEEDCEICPVRKCVMSLIRRLDMDTYKVSMLKKMLEHETNETEEHYGANLHHWYGDTKALTIDAGGLHSV